MCTFGHYCIYSLKPLKIDQLLKCCGVYRTDKYVHLLLLQTRDETCCMNLCNPHFNGGFEIITFFRIVQNKMFILITEKTKPHKKNALRLTGYILIYVAYLQLLAFTAASWHSALAPENCWGSLGVIKYQITACLIKVTLIKVLLRFKHKYCSVGQADIIISMSSGICDTASEKYLFLNYILF